VSSRDKEARAIEQAFLIEQAGKEALAKARAEVQARLQPKVEALVYDMASLKLMMKALVHDLEATRKERDCCIAELRRQGHNVRFDRKGRLIVS